jgi:hypothetical protein
MKQFEVDLKKSKYEYRVIKQNIFLGIVFVDKLDIALGDPPCRVLLVFTPVTKLYYGAILRWKNFESMGEDLYRTLNKRYGNPKKEDVVDIETGNRLGGYKWETNNMFMYLTYDKTVTLCATIHSGLMNKALQESKGK